MAYMSKRQTSNGVVPIGSNLYGTANASGVVSMPDFNVLVSGVTIHVKFTAGGTYSSLAVGSTSARPISRNGASGTIIEAGAVKSFTYDGSSWVQNDAEQGGSTYGLSISGSDLSLVSGGSATTVTLPTGETYQISISGHTITLTGSEGDTSSVTVPDNDTQYGLSINGHAISLVEGGSGTQVTVPDNNTTYTLSVSGNTLTLTGSDGSTSSITIPAVVTYSLSKEVDDIVLTGSDGSTSSVTDNNTIYGLSIRGNSLSLNGSDGSSDTVSLPTVPGAHVIEDNIGWYMTANHVVNMTESISEQKYGIILVWSIYANGAAQDYGWQFQFIPVWLVEAGYGGSVVNSIFYANPQTGNVVCKKTLYVDNNTITGHANNAGSGSGYNNSFLVLRAVLGI